MAMTNEDFCQGVLDSLPDGIKAAIGAATASAFVLDEEYPGMRTISAACRIHDAPLPPVAAAFGWLPQPFSGRGKPLWAHVEEGSHDLGVLQNDVLTVRCFALYRTISGAKNIRFRTTQ